MPEQLYIRNTLSPGDYIVLSAAVRDLHKNYPGRFQTMVEVPQPAIYANNPYVTHFGMRPGIRSITASYHKGLWSVHKSNQQPAHFLWGFIGDLNLELKLNIKLTDFRPDLYLTEEEKKTPLVPKPYWVFASGGKTDFTAKWWDPTWWQTVVDRMKEWVTMVQVGGGSHQHPPVKGVYDLVNKTSFRDLMRLIYHAEGVLCIVTCFMHIAAAFNKPCVVVAGGREGWQWEAYDDANRLNNMRLGNASWSPPPNDNFIPHKFLHTIGQLDCCKSGGCWCSKVAPGGGKSCSKTTSQHGRLLPRCMQMITPETVLGAVEWYYQKGILSRTKEPSIIVQPRETPPPIVPAVFVKSPPVTDFEVFEGEVDPSKFKDLKKEWALWLGKPPKDSQELSKWLSELGKKAAEKPNSAFGMACCANLSATQSDMIKKATWFTGVPLTVHPLNPSMARAIYPEKGWLFAAPANILKTLDFSQVSAEDCSIFLGEALRQRGLTLTDIGGLVEES